MLRHFGSHLESAMFQYRSINPDAVGPAVFLAATWKQKSHHVFLRLEAKVYLQIYYHMLVLWQHFCWPDIYSIDFWKRAGSCWFLLVIFHFCAQKFGTFIPLSWFGLEFALTWSPLHIFALSWRLVLYPGLGVTSLFLQTTICLCMSSKRVRVPWWLLHGLCSLQQLRKFGL